MGRLVKVEKTKHFIVKDFRDPPKREIRGYRAKKLPDGTVLTFAILTTKGPRGGRTALVNEKKPRSQSGRSRRR